jgi:hypothetical protein
MHLDIFDFLRFINSVYLLVGFQCLAMLKANDKTLRKYIRIFMNSSYQKLKWSGVHVRVEKDSTKKDWKTASELLFLTYVQIQKTGGIEAEAGFSHPST